LALREKDGPSELASKGFERAANAFEALIRNADPQAVDRGFRRTIAAAAYHLAGFSAVAYSLFNETSEDLNVGELFDIDFRQAVKLIGALVTELQAQVHERGVITRILRDKGYGFLRSDGLDFFVHHIQVQPSFDDLGESDAVEFNRIETSEGLAAVMVSRSSSAASRPAMSVHRASPASGNGPGDMR
jgi:cold shock CspA family protein